MQNYSFKKTGLLLLLSSSFILTSCVELNHPITQDQKNKLVNNWIQGYMDVVYLWNTRMSVQKDKTLFPADYFKSLLYKTEDHFSYIAEDYTELSDYLSGIQMEAGYDFTLLRTGNDEDVVGIINYIKPHSLAASTSLKRGDIFRTVNGKQLTLKNYQQLVKEMSAAHTLGVSRNNTIQTLSLKVGRYEENPVLLDSLYTIGGKKIAYLIFNFFSVDKGDNSYAYLTGLNKIFGKYKQANVDELILDFRYNGGGQVTVATALAGMISNRTSSDLFSIDQYNSIVDKQFKEKYGNDYNKTFFSDSLIIQNEGGTVITRVPYNKLTGLKRLYVLTSDRTASASELVINGLKPYMTVVLVGGKTYGKNVGMWFIYEENSKKQKNNRWGMLPIVVKTYNSANKSDYSKGFDPTVKTDEYAVLPLLPLGDTHELLLEAALNHIGVQKPNAARSAEERFNAQALMSSIDLTPVRNNMIINNLDLYE